MICRPCRNRRKRQWYLDRKTWVLDHYSDGTHACMCCGERELVFLCLDHVRNDGSKMRRQYKRNGIWEATARGLPEDFQVLCFNCNRAKYLQGFCPHER